MKSTKRKTKNKKTLNTLKRMRHSRGFTMVELIATIMILGILTTISVVAIQGVVKKARDNYHRSQEDNISAAARNYAEKNQQYLPKVNGQATTITLSSLRKAKYIDKVKDYTKKDCDENNSYVQVFLYDEAYYYTPYLVCPNYTSNAIEKYEHYDINVSFTGGVTGSRAHLSIKEPDAGIVSYNYKIYADGKQVYASGNLDANKKTEVQKDLDIVEYTPAIIKITVTATNGTGVGQTKSFTKDYTDQKPADNPKCVYPAIGASTTWTSGARTIQVKCNDEAGIGCAKDIFTKKFDSSMQQGEIKIYDKEGNFNLCTVDVYIDKESPTITLRGYKRAASGGKENTTVAGTAKADNAHKTSTFKITSNLTNGWLNKYQYPNGISLELEYSDLSPITSIEYKVNSPGLKTSASNAKEYSSTIVNPKKNNGTYTIDIPDQGSRFGEIIVTDSAGNKSSITLEVPIDLTPPSKPAPRSPDINADTGMNWNANGPKMNQKLKQGYGAYDGQSDDAPTYLYCIKYNDATVPGKDDACFTSSLDYERACGRTVYAYELAVDTAGNRSDVSKIGSGSDAESNYNSWTECSAQCGESGTKTGTSTCALDSQKVEACNRRDCCSSTYPVERGDCSASCGGGRKKRDIYSNYNGQWCSSDWNGGSCNTEACWVLPEELRGQSYNCKVRGTVKKTVPRWTCTRGHSHTTAYIHYCYDGNGQLVFKQDYSRKYSRWKDYGYNDRNQNTYDYVCPTNPYTRGWILIPD